MVSEGKRLCKKKRRKKEKKIKPPFPLTDNPANNLGKCINSGTGLCLGEGLNTDEGSESERRYLFAFVFL